MNFEIVVREVEEGKVIKESLIKEIQVCEPKSIREHKYFIELSG